MAGKPAMLDLRGRKPHHPSLIPPPPAKNRTMPPDKKVARLPKAMLPALSGKKLPKKKRARHGALLEAALRRSLSIQEVLELREAIVESRGDRGLSIRIVELLRKASVLLALAHTAAEAFTLDALLPAITAELVAAFGADTATLFLHDAGQDCLVARMQDLRGLREMRVAMESGIAGWVFRHDQPVHVRDAYADPRFNPEVDKDTGRRTREILAAPVRSPRGRIGVVEVLGSRPGQFAPADLELLVAAMAQLAVPLENARLLEELNLHRALQRKAEGEMSAGRLIQMGLLPRPGPVTLAHAGLDVAAVIEPAKPLGGDLYDHVMVGPDTLFFLVGDVSGKGLPAALFMAVAHTLLRTHARRRDLTLAEVVTRVNAELWEENPQELFVTAFAGLLDCRTGMVEYVMAGHEPPFLLHPAAGGAETVTPLAVRPNPALCMDPEVTYTCHRLHLAPGGMLLLYTDGVTEAMDPQAHPFGAARVARALATLPGAATAQQAVATLRGAVEDWRAGSPPYDDLTILAVRWLGPPG